MMSEEEIQQLKNIQSRINALMDDNLLTAYFIGYCLALGLNWGDESKNFLECFFYSILSWINVGYLLAHN